MLLAMFSMVWTLGGRGLKTLPVAGYSSGWLGYGVVAASHPLDMVVCGMVGELGDGVGTIWHQWRQRHISVWQDRQYGENIGAASAIISGIGMKIGVAAA